ncbi:GNAT family N-acetyltransferase [Pararhodobacter zhoushanensis]|nr:GNAT family N-acetyltransferase [Pararhodobacter zhoushanensis]
MSDALFAALEASWPPLTSETIGPFRVRNGAGGGKRVSATVLEGAFSEAALDALGEQPLFQLRTRQTALDAALEKRGYRVVDPTLILSAPVETVAETPRPVSLPTIWPPLAIQRHIWAEGHIGPERIAVMERACDPKMSFIARFQDRAAGVGFLAIHQGIAMLHALHIDPDFRRKGVAHYMVRGMADWAQRHGATTFALAVTQANAGARALYTRLGMLEVDAYHYREKQP